MPRILHSTPGAVSIRFTDRIVLKPALYASQFDSGVFLRLRGLDERSRRLMWSATGVPVPA